MGQILLAWLPATWVDSLQSTIPSIALRTVGGIFLISLGAFLHIAARISLGDLAHFPIIVKPSVSARQLYVPPSFSSTRDIFGRLQEPENRLDKQVRVQWSLRSAHELVKTGPYRFARHPMYGGALLALAGSTVIHFAPGSVMRTISSCMGLSSPILLSSFPSLTGTLTEIGSAWAVSLEKVTWAGLAMLTLGFVLLGTVLGLMRMARREDEALEGRFGQRWIVYRWSVRPMFIPGLF